MPIGLQLNYRSNMEQALPGLATEEIRLQTYFNAAQGSGQIETLTVTAAANGDTITVSKLGLPNVVVTLDATSGASVGAARNAVLAALQADYQWMTRYAIASSSTAAITLTDRYPGVVTPVATVGVTGTTTATLTITTAATSPVATPYGLVVASKTSYTTIDGIPTCAVPSASGDIVQGVVRATHKDATRNFDQTANSDPINRAFTVLKQGVIWTVSEAAIAANDTQIYYRHTANGALTTLGAIAPASGTGLAELVGAVARGASELIEDGRYITPIYLNVA